MPDDQEREQILSGPLALMGAINRLLSRAKVRGQPLILSPVPGPPGQDGGWRVSLGGHSTGVYEEAAEAVLALDRETE